MKIVDRNMQEQVNVIMNEFTNLMQLNIYLCTISSTCFGLTRPSSGAMDDIISLHIQQMVSLV